MGSISCRHFTFLLIIVLLIWSSSMEGCYARRGKHWRQSRGIGVSLSKKKGKNHGTGYHHGHVNKSKKKTPSPKAPPAFSPPSSTPSPPISSRPSPPILAPRPPQKGYGNAPSTSIFNVLNFGAKGDGTTDDTKAFQAAWAAACKVEASTIVVPSDSVFLVGPISFSGPYCQHDIVFQLDGTIIAPTNTRAWGSGTLQWLQFTKLVGITIQGSGTIDGRGAAWWQDSPLQDPVDSESKLIVPLNGTVGRNPSIPVIITLPSPCYLHQVYFVSDFKHKFFAPDPGLSRWKNAEHKTNGKSNYNNQDFSLELPDPSTFTNHTFLLQALRFYGSFNVSVTGITIQNSPQCHLKFDSCIGVSVYNFSVSSPGDSPNTDGIHLQNSRDVLIRSTNVACGDDCVSIQTGCTNVYIHNINCGPGHGISIGGLGKDETRACVSNITIRDIIMHQTMNGVRIKTWQGGSGSVQGVLFSNIIVSEVQLPIVIDQFYCDKTTCKNQSSAVALSGIHYENIRGTYTVKPVHLACSDNVPCTQVTLNDIELKPLQERYHMYDPYCWQTFGELYSPTEPPIECLQIGKPPGNRIQADHDSC